MDTALSSFMWVKHSITTNSYNSLKLSSTSGTTNKYAVGQVLCWNDNLNCKMFSEKWYNVTKF